MRTIFLSDIHANFPALAGALGRAEKLGADRVYAAGDLIGRGPHPVETLRLLARSDIPAVRGNVEERLLKLRNDGVDFKRMFKKKGSRLAWTALKLGAEEWEYLSHLPRTLALTVQGHRLLILHGSPLSETDSIYPSITLVGLRAKMGTTVADVLVCGHTHIPFTKSIGGVRLVGCGSVGLPVDGDPRGSMAVCDFAPDEGARCRILRFSYPVEGLIADIGSRGAPGIDPAVFKIQGH